MDVVLDNLDKYGSGMWVTVELTALSFLLALAVGTVVAGMRVSPSAPVRAAGTLYVETVRNTPPLVLLFLFVYGLPKAGVIYSLFTSAVIVLGCYTGAFVGEALRSGIASVPVGQAEAARALGLSFTQTLRSVVLPQAFRTVIPPIGGLLSALVRNSALAAVIGVADLTYQAERVNTAHTDPIPIFIGAMICYLILTLPLGALIGFAERRLAVTR
ncbi:amino acid ABC transporter permease [Frankia sp. CNm7]|uniref:Amino acid ABC transporter permease n=1 Tax=Frankia nepalensis TaxID=1836974 RepID=A0A937RLV9_9ACTN|nr:amino acid ABC transporter permease [Frankia nepalensis]MBL7497309.1 amino acid ABC transporter permease [Frankia nepalensis]MBL7511146.1 amino acid ABC transporter permease [Frankia nepalensis]MBL7519676.1 amino acid ABC transporter permease [Frankia nepalensis]MBL7631219.1 amino acid ABC transporter permease [Frankia nepalensis]